MTFSPIRVMAAQVESKSRPGLMHDILVFGDGRVTCDCEGFRARQTCTHLREVGAALARIGLCPICDEGRLGLTAVDAATGGPAAACNRCEFAIEVHK